MQLTILSYRNCYNAPTIDHELNLFVHIIVNMEVLLLHKVIITTWNTVPVKKSDRENKCERETNRWRIHLILVKTLLSW